ncbi:putative manganese-dependent inorganic pyrophosphatase [Pedobacter glucosidilyticus]|uniref:CBS domain-containing protein n=1 Tax=Pedobacter aquae TaxID=2605747 RepID=A0A5C0VF97_9SPHI|nr:MULTISPECIES: CBS domain-containing protein [Pedobacter]KHJ38526.1 putative manganese-dependent inorganic pyrophosphatase [Pedobacter glucosidilyticus]QEK50543.1 CBS domain-containing protein [Pedobacter aquae]
MIAAQLISDAIPSIKTSDTIQKVEDRMAEFRLNHLPIVNETQFLGLISDEDIIEIPDYDTTVANVNLSLINPFVYEDQHIYEVIKLFYEQKLTAVPVLDSSMNYLGLISINTLTEYFAKITSVTDPGGIIVLEISNRNNSLSHIAQIVESNNAQILSSYVDTVDNSTKLEITIKVNKTDISQIVASFLRYDYTIKATFNHLQRDNDSKNRFDSLMNYLSFD